MAGRDKIPVEQKHIDRAMPASSSKCMIAEAVKDAKPGAHNVHVDLATIRYTDAEGNRKAYLTPGKCQVALVEFDAGIEQEPFSFYLGHPIHIRKSGRAHVKIHSQGRNTRADDLDVTKVGGARPPVLRNVTRRRFGIRGLRVNEAGQVVKDSTFTEPLR
jgi:hypothetical protein